MTTRRTERAKAICEGCGEIVVPLSLCKACGSFAAVTVRLGSEDYCDCGMPPQDRGQPY